MRLISWVGGIFFQTFIKENIFAMINTHPFSDVILFFVEMKWCELVSWFMFNCKYVA
jgi:hypothetical protein